MRTLLNIVIRGFILWVASLLFPETFQINDMRTLVLATVLLWVVSLIIELLCALAMGAGIALDNVIIVICGLTLLLFSEVITMTILSNNLDGFMIVGFWPKVLLSICYSMLFLGTPSDTNSNSE